jgi:flavin reductase (DIM6/NTAB) family NADH-FMN oxidoreductase RutF
VRDAHRRFPTGVTVVTARGADGSPHGLAVNAFASVSLEPPSVLVCVACNSLTHTHLCSASHAAINILSHSQQDVATTFARSGGDKFAGLDWRPGAGGAPVLAGVSAHVEMSIEARLSAHTYTMLIGQVIEAHSTDTPPLVYLDGGFFDGARLTGAA